jgi:hypothetical protein
MDLVGSKLGLVVSLVGVVGAFIIKKLGSKEARAAARRESGENGRFTFIFDN